MMMSPAFTTVAYDSSGNPYQMAYPAGTAFVQAPFPVASQDPRGAYEMIPHRIFVGGFPAATTELDLRTFFEQFGHVREAKVIRSSEGTSKGYGFITFDSEDEAKNVMQISTNQDAEKFEFKGRRLNLGPAIRRVIHGPRYAPEYAITTPSGQILAASAFGGFTYGYPQSPIVMVPPNQLQSLVYSPVPAVTSPQFAYPGPDVTSGRSQQVACGAPVVVMSNSCGNVTPHDSPRGNNFATQQAQSQQQQQQQSVAGPIQVTAGGQTQQQYCMAPGGIQQVAQMAQPLTPITPSINPQRAAVYPQNSYFPISPAPLNDMTHYSQMTAPTYFYAANGFPAIDTGIQATAAITVPAAAPVAQMLNQPQTPQQCYYDEGVMTGWQNSAEVRQASTPRRSPLKPVISLAGQLNQVSIQQYDRKECQQSNPVNGASSNKQF